MKKSTGMAAAAVTAASVCLAAVTAFAAGHDGITGATKKREATSGVFSLMNSDGRRLLIEMARSFIWTGDSVFNGNLVKGGRQMFSIATSYNNVPENITAELTPEYFPETGTFLFYGTTAKDSGKILRTVKSGTGVSVAWVKQLRENEVRDYGYNYYDSYGVQFDAGIEVLTSKDINTGDPEKDRSNIRRLTNIMSKSLSTIKEWSLLWNFAPSLTGAELEKAQEAAIRDFMSYEDVYILKPKSMIVIGYFYRPLMVSVKNAFVYRDYALDSSVEGFRLETAPGYLAALRDTNCACTVSPSGRSQYPYFDSQFPKEDQRNLINRLAAYRNTVLFGTPAPAAGAKPLPAAWEKIEKMYNNGGKMLTLAEIDARVKEDPEARMAYYWEDTSKAADMPDRFMITYTGKDSSLKAYRVDLPNWNRWFMRQPGNLCGIATRNTLVW